MVVCEWVGGRVGGELVVVRVGCTVVVKMRWWRVVSFGLVGNDKVMLEWLVVGRCWAVGWCGGDGWMGGGYMLVVVVLVKLHWWRLWGAEQAMGVDGGGVCGV